MSPKPVRLFITAFMAVNIITQWVVSLIAQTIFIIFSKPFVTKEQRDDVCSRIFRYASGYGCVFFNPFWTAHIIRPAPVLPTTEKDGSKSKILVMMNHISDADAFTVVWSMFPYDCSWICKDELFRLPIGGRCLANAGDIPVMFKNKREGNETVKGSVPAMMEKVKEKLRRGRMIAVFPEGTRSKDPDGPVQPFKNGFFRLAIEEGAWIAPLAMSGTHHAWPRGPALMDTTDAYFSWGEPIDARTYNGDIDRLREDTWKIISDLRDSHPDRRKRV